MLGLVPRKRLELAEAKIDVLRDAREKLLLEMADWKSRALAAEARVDGMGAIIDELEKQLAQPPAAAEKKEPVPEPRSLTGIEVVTRAMDHRNKRARA